MAQIDIFSPFRGKAEEHEDRLAWGFLVALKYAPALQVFFRDLIMRHVPQERWPSGEGWDPAAISAQTNEVGSEASVVVSVLLTDASLPDSVDVKKSDRAARYDGVVEYPDGLVFVIENKPRSSAVWQDQLSPSRDSFSGLSEEVDLYEQVVSIEWAEVLEGLLKYTSSPISSYPERTIAEDFLAFAEDCHSSLSPTGHLNSVAPAKKPSISG